MISGTTKSIVIVKAYLADRVKLPQGIRLGSGRQSAIVVGAVSAKHLSTHGTVSASPQSIAKGLPAVGSGTFGGSCN